MKSVGALLQLNAMLLLVIQLIFVPRLFGPENFAIAMLLLAPSFIAQGVFEPISQWHVFLKKGAGIFWVLVCLWVAVLVVIGFQVCLYVSGHAFVAMVLLAVHAFAFLLLTLHTLWALEARRHRTLIASQIFGIAAYLMVSMFSIDEGSLGIVGANLAMCIIGVTILAVAKAQLLPVYEEFEFKDFARGIFASLPRVPTIFLNSVSVMLVGFFVAPILLAHYRVSVSSVNALKYVTPYSSNQIIHRLSQAMQLEGKDERFKVLFVQMLSACGFWIFGSFCVLLIFPYYVQYVFGSSDLPAFWWMIPTAGALFQLLQPLVFFLKQNIATKWLLVVVVLPCAVICPVYIINPFIAFFVNCVLSVAFAIVAVCRVFR